MAQVIQGDLFANPGLKSYMVNFLCPLCKTHLNRSDYLHGVFSEEPVLEWFANLITHYRHGHISSWNKCWGAGGGRYRSGWFGDYDTQKGIVNERAKRQLIRQAFPIFRECGLKPEHIAILQNTTEETMRVANKFLK
jgi:hypothetical protein